MDTDGRLILCTDGVKDTFAIGRAAAKYLSDGDCLLLDGSLGAGKTQFAKGVAAGLGIADEVISPTFNLVLEYRGGRKPLFHFDLYRLEDAAQLEDLDFFYMADDGTPGISLIEWASKFPEDMPEDALSVDIYDRGGSMDDAAQDGCSGVLRSIAMASSGKRSAELLSAMRADDIINRYVCQA